MEKPPVGTGNTQDQVHQPAVLVLVWASITWRWVIRTDRHGATPSWATETLIWSSWSKRASTPPSPENLVQKRCPQPSQQNGVYDGPSMRQAQAGARALKPGSRGRLRSGRMERGLPGFCPISRAGLSRAASYGLSGADYLFFL